jgi:endogenous inhibitor of DNA gyrase (YacG/DUF329 family)
MVHDRVGEMMSVYRPDDIVEFVNYENVSEFGLIISVQISDTISALVVSGFQSNKPQWISTEQVKGHWRNVKDCVSLRNDIKAECAYCGKPYKKKKKAQRFCSIKCKDKWWNRERFADSEYLHPQCEDNFSGDC